MPSHFEVSHSAGKSLSFLKQHSRGWLKNGEKTVVNYFSYYRLRCEVAQEDSLNYSEHAINTDFLCDPTLHNTGWSGQERGSATYLISFLTTYGVILYSDADSICQVTKVMFNQCWKIFHLSTRRTKQRKTSSKCTLYYIK